MRRSLRLTPKVALAFALFATALLVVVGILAFANGRDALEAATFADLLSSAIEKEAAFERWIATGQMYLTTLAESPFIQAQVAALHNRATPDDTIIFRENLVAELTPRTGSGRLFANLMILHPESGQVIAATDASELGTFKEDRLYFVNGKNTSYVQNVHFALECECPAITASVPLQSSDGALLGVLAGQLNLEEMEIIINRSSGVNQSADAYLVNTANILVTQPRGIEDAVVLQRGIRTQATELCLAGNSGSIMSNDYRGVPVMSVYRWLPNRELCLVVNVDQAEALSPVSEFGRTLLAISLVTLFIASVIAVALARTITRPIVALTESVVRFGRGDTRIRFRNGRTMN